MGYNSLALVYDKLMEEIDYEAWAQYLEQLITLSHAPGKKLIDLGCGTGSISLILAQRGYSVTGIDYSLDMLTQAEQKFRQNRVVIPLYKLDIKDLKIEHPVDIMISTFDTLNYILIEQELEKIFTNVYRGLKDEGVFIFDLNTPYKLKNVLGNNVHTFNTEEIAYIWENNYDNYNNICQMDLTFFLLDNGTGLYQRFEEYHEQKAYEVVNIKALLEKVNFKVVGIYGELSLNEPREEDNKMFFVAKKVRT